MERYEQTGNEILSVEERKALSMIPECSIWEESGFFSTKYMGAGEDIAFYYEPSSLEDWESKYRRSGVLGEDLKRRLPSFLSQAEYSAECDKIDASHGKTEAQLNDLANRFSHYLEEKRGITLSDKIAYNIAVYKCVDEPYERYLIENVADRILERFAARNRLSYDRPMSWKRTQSGIRYLSSNGNMLCEIDIAGDVYSAGPKGKLADKKSVKVLTAEISNRSGRYYFANRGALMNELYHVVAENTEREKEYSKTKSKETEKKSLEE